MYYLRLLIPSWRFFSNTDVFPRLYVQRDGESEWLSILNPPRPRWYNLFLNPAGSFHHAVCNSVEALMQSPQDADAYRVVNRFVRWYLLKERQEAPGLKYRFKVGALVLRGDSSQIEDVLISSAETL